MIFPDDFWELIFMVILFIIGSIIYVIAIRNRGSFADTPDWSKVVRRISELSCVFIALLLIWFIGLHDKIKIKYLFIIFPIVVILIVPICIVVSNKIRKNSKRIDTERLNEYLINAIILALFMLSGMLVLLITFARGTKQLDICIYLLLLLDFVLSVEFAFLLFQIYSMVILNNVPREEIIQIIRICKELNE